MGAQNRGRHEACPYGNVSIMYDPEIHHRQSLRWDKHNYSSPGFYYVTICIQDHRSLLGNVQSGVMNLNDAGEMVDAAWLRIPTQFPTIQLDEHITMPNHFHGIIQIVDRGVGVPLVGTQPGGIAAFRAPTRGAPTATLGGIAAFRAPTRGAPTATLGGIAAFRAPTRGAPTSVRVRRLVNVKWLCRNCPEALELLQRPA